MALTPKQQRFVDAYMLNPNAAKAARAAGSSAKRADQAGYEFLSNPDVRAEIDRRQAERAEETKIDAAWVLKRLAAEAQADVADLYDDGGNLLPVKQWPLIWRQGLVAGIDVEELFEGRGEDRQRVGNLVKIKLSDRVRRLELIGKHIGVNAFQDIVEHKGLDSLADRLARAAKRSGDE